MTNYFETYRISIMGTKYKIGEIFPKFPLISPDWFSKWHYNSWSNATICLLSS